MTSLHVKHRPTTFGGVIGQGDAVRSLERVVKEGRAHTFIFTGPSGTGKTTLARILANCFAQGQATVANIDEIDAASNSGADAMRAVVTKALYRAVGASPVKAIIVDECHRLSAAAWTILLKPIEEPPKHVYWMLCSTEPGKIPKTIQTRCLRYELKLVDEVSIYELLLKVSQAESFDISEDVLEVIAEGSGGSPRQALVFLEACRFSESPSDARRIIRTAAQMKEPVDLARLLIAKRGASWHAALKIINSMDNVEAEGVRIVMVNYIAGALARSRTDDEAKNLLRVLDCFSGTYNSSDKMAPLFISVGLALGLDQ